MSESRAETVRWQPGAWRWGALAVGVLGLLLCAVGGLRGMPVFPSYLFALLFWLGISLGCLAITMLHHIVGGAWGVPVRRTLEAGAMLLPLLALLFVPLLFGLGALYPWARPADVAADPILLHKQPYLNVAAFVLRAIIYFLIWSALAWLLNRWSLQQDGQDGAALARRMAALSRAGLILYFLTVTFSSIDWVMSIEAHWYSTIFGLIYIAGQGLAGFALAIIAVGWLSQRGPLRDVTTPDHFNDLGNLLLVFVMFWAYIALSQFLLIWSGNLPEEVTWYTERSGGGWNWVALFVIVCQFGLPFLALLLRRIKRTPSAIMGLAAFILVVHLVDLFWLVMPPFRPTFNVDWLDVAAPLGIGGVWIFGFLWLLPRRSLVLAQTIDAEAAEEQAVRYG